MSDTAPPTLPFRRVALLGLGFMAASLAARIRKVDPSVRLFGTARKFETRQQAEAINLVERAVEDPAEAVADCDLVIACTPVGAIPPVLSEALAGLQPGCVVTDVGSTKAWLEQRLKDAVAQVDGVFVGGHPMCGSERTGIEHARPQIYEGAAVVLTSRADADTDAGRKLEQFWSALGSRPLWMDADEHDRVVARTSHLPHLLATVLATTVAREGLDNGVGELCGTGFAGTSRLAEGSPAMWRDILRTNREPVLAELRTYAEEMTRFADLLEEESLDELTRWLEQGRDERRDLISYREQQHDA